MNNRKINRIATTVMLCCACQLALAITGCQPQNRSGMGFSGFGNRPLNSNSPLGGGGLAFNNPFQSGPASFSNNSGARPPSLFGNGNRPNNGSIAGTTGTPGVGAPGFPSPGLGQEFNRINQQLGAFDADNQQLNADLATLKQKLELANQYNQTLKQQLADTSDRANQSGNQQRANAQQFASMQQQIEQLNRRIMEQDRMLAQRPAANTQGNFQNTGFRDTDPNSPFQNSSFNRSGNNGSATLRANNGLMQKLSAIQIPGGNAQMDGDIIRIEFPTDRLFSNGSYRIQPSQLPVLQNIASTIRQSFPRQIIGVEAHWDGTPLNPPGTTAHQLTSTQSLAIIEELVRLGLPERQMFVMGLGSNRPRHRQQNVGGISPNRRIELVIYPESYDGN